MQQYIRVALYALLYSWFLSALCDGG